MSETAEEAGTYRPVHYELFLSPEEARQGTTKLLSRNNKRLEVRVPPGVNAGSRVKLGNALQLTDGHPGDILIEIKIKPENATASGAGPAEVVEITDANFESEVLKAGLPVAVDFWAPWCGPCRMIAPVMDRMAEQYRGRFKFCKINVDENPQTAGRYQAMSIPMLLFFRDGQIIDRSVGAISEKQLQSRLEALL